MFDSFMHRRRQEFRDTFAEYARSKQEQDLKRIEIPTARFFDKGFIENLFVSYGRIPKNIDTTTFQNRIAIVTTDGELWAGDICLLESMSFLDLRITADEILEIEAFQ